MARDAKSKQPFGPSASVRRVGFTRTLFLGSLLAVGCVGGGRPAARAAPDTPPAPGEARPEAQPSRRAARRARPAAPEARPTPGVKAPMKGEPADAELAQARLVAMNCEKAHDEDVEALVKEMRAAVDRSFKEWHDAQPSCWQQMREEARGFITAYGTGMGGSVAFGSAASGPRLARKMSGTNNQIAGVDEADVVKTDGRFVYFAANGALRIAEALAPRVVSVTKLPGAARDLFVEGDRAVVYTSSGARGRAPCTYGYDCAFGGDGTSTTVSVYDVADRSAPRLVRTFDLSGSLVAARRIGRAVHTVVADGDAAPPPYDTWPDGLPTCGTAEPAVRANFARLKADNERALRAKSLTRAFPTLTEGGLARPLCDGLLRPKIRDGRAFTTVVSFDLTDDRAAPTSTTLQSRPGAVFASADALYLAVAHRRPGGGGRLYDHYPRATAEVSDIHKFRIGASPAETRYVGSGTVPGHVLNQFAMDEWHGYLRVATSKGRVPDPRVESAVSVFAESEQGNLVRVGAVEKIAPGEDVRAVRFEGDRGYVVTFKKTDPLFVLDLLEPARPRVLGELKIPGFSTYLHRVDPEHLLSIGFDADDKGDFAYFGGVILQLFDVKDPASPKLTHKETIGSRGSSSGAATDHLAFNYLAAEGLLAVPMTICEGGGDGRFGDSLTFSGLLVYDVDVERGFTRLGGVDHGAAGVDCQTWWSQAKSAVKRSIFLDDLVYSIADDRAKVQRLGGLGVDVADLPLSP
jgi:beta propeller domain-containing protein